MEDRTTIVLAAIQALTQAEYRTYLDLLAEDVCFYVAGITDGNGVIGRSAVWDEILGPSLKTRSRTGYREDIVSLIADGDWIAVESRGFQNTTDGTPYDNSYLCFYRVADGVIQDVRFYLDSDLTHKVKGL